jgi:lipopolysaccharide export system protein LptA
MKKIVMGALLALLAAVASAERGDANKAAIINAESIDADQVALTRVLTGNVTVEKGTLKLAAAKAVIKESPEGYLSLVLTSAGGQPATFRQKRDGGADLWVEGQAQRIEYDERTQIVKLFGNAKVKQLDGSKVTDELDAEFISYDSRMEQLVSRNDASGQNKVGKGRSTLVIAPHRTATPAPAPGNR